SLSQVEFISENPQYELKTKINNLELFVSEYNNEMVAHINMEFWLTKYGEEQVIVKHHSSLEKQLMEKSFSTFVQTVNEILLEETDLFISKMLIHFKGSDAVSLSIQKEVAVGDTTLAPFTALETELSESGTGLLLLPAISGTENEPYYDIFNGEGLVGNGQMGFPIPLPSGAYTIRYGSGPTLNLLMRETNVIISPRYKTILEPKWGCLSIAITDENRDYLRMQYELFDAETGESYGTEFPAEEEVGELEKIWVIKPGYYKVTINNEPFNTYQNFTTVYVKAKEMQKLTIVVETDEDGNPKNLIGAGILEDDDIFGDIRHSKLSVAVHGNANLTRDNSTDQKDATTIITLMSQFDIKYIYDNGPYYFNDKTLLEIGTSRGEDQDFRISSDDVSIKNTFIYYFLQNIGAYVRGDINTHLFNEKVYPGDSENYRLIDKDGNITEYINPKSIKVKPEIFPLVLKEGIGVNVRLRNTAKINVSVRSGFGMRQDFNQNVYSFQNTSIDNNGIEWNVYEESPNSTQEGLECSIISTVQLPFNISYSSSADALFPFDKDKSASYEWENIFNMKLTRYISIDYKLQLSYNEEIVEYTVIYHSLYLRLTYFLY
ncbi:MAG: hypothetical protein K8S56_09525, partial [Candidatus Cloacimonetes bacterium]|nr:hypothetical protein [Candidatus Cloacimonadota bacterium]